MKQLLNQSLVIGNGESRQDLNISLLIDNYTTIGCNAVHRDIDVDHLVCCDQRMVREAVENSVGKIYTRENWADTFKKFPQVFRVPDLPYTGLLRMDQPFHWGSGSYAVLLAATLSDNISLIGFDLYGTNNCVNNVYKNTANYSEADKRAVDPTYWIYQISKVFSLYPDKYFTVFNRSNWPMPDSWHLNNVKFKTLDTLQ